MKEIPKPSLEEVFEHYGLRIIGPDRGTWRRAQCPLPDHQDDNPSASVHEEWCKWHCSACDETGDAIDVIMRRDGVGWARAVEIAKGFSGASDGDVSGERRSSSLLPRRQGHRPGRGNFTPPWSRL